MKQKVNQFEDLFVWQQARELVKLIYSVSKFWKDFGLKDQIQRAVVSVMSNIAEGFERGTKDEFLHFLYIARGSCGEVRAVQKNLGQGWACSYGGQRRADPGYEDNKRFEEHLQKVVEEARKKREATQ